MKRRPVTATRRRAFLEQLENRICPAFEIEISGSAVLIKGTNDRDVLMGIELRPIDASDDAIVIFTNTSGGGVRAKQDFVPKGSVNATTPITIAIVGYGGNDYVEFNDGQTYSGSLTGFPPSSISLIRFFGDKGDDTMDTNFGTSFPLPSPIVPPGPSGSPNIQFFGGLGKDELIGGIFPDYFDGGPGNDTAHGSVETTGCLAATIKTSSLASPAMTSSLAVPVPTLGSTEVQGAT